MREMLLKALVSVISHPGAGKMSGTSYIMGRNSATPFVHRTAHPEKLTECSFTL